MCLDDFRVMQYFYSGFIWITEANGLLLGKVLASKFPFLRFFPVAA